MTKKKTELLPCPFCGGEAKIKYIGNDYTKKRSIEIECNCCHIKKRISALYQGLEWLEDKIIDFWNRRAK